MNQHQGEKGEDERKGKMEKQEGDERGGGWDEESVLTYRSKVPRRTETR